MTTPTILCEQCQQPIGLRPGAYRIVGIARQGQGHWIKWPSVYVHVGNGSEPSGESEGTPDCLTTWREANTITRQAQ